jgi:hypothetical protein
MRHELLEPWTIGADFNRTAQDINLPYEFMNWSDQYMSTR